MKEWIIDRFEGEYAVCEGEDGRMKNIPKVWLPHGVAEGDCLQEQEDGSFVIDTPKTQERRAANLDLLKSLLKPEEE